MRADVVHTPRESRNVHATCVVPICRALKLIVDRPLASTVRATKTPLLIGVNSAVFVGWHVALTEVPPAVGAMPVKTFAIDCCPRGAATGLMATTAEGVPTGGLVNGGGVATTPLQE